MATRHFRSLFDVSREELDRLLKSAAALKAARGAHDRPLEGKSVAVIFEKASTRTRLSFDVGIHELGAHSVTLMAKDTQMGRGEPLEDTSRMLSGYVHGVVIRTHGHERLEQLCGASRIPVVNGLTDRYHPCQLLADLQTLRESFDTLADLQVAWIGDGNNMAHSWAAAAARAGFTLRLASPKGYEIDRDVLAQARAEGASIVECTSVEEAAKGAHVVTTDVWASMGQEDEVSARKAAFAGFCVDEALMVRASKDAVFLHCLPAHRGEEVSAGVLEGPQSRVWDEAENRLHAQKALLAWLLGEDA
ncbi:MAG: ornithine carbamoyltransferase [Myxococcota bacterium]